MYRTPDRLYTAKFVHFAINSSINLMAAALSISGKLLDLFSSRQCALPVIPIAFPLLKKKAGDMHDTNANSARANLREALSRSCLLCVLIVKYKNLAINKCLWHQKRSQRNKDRQRNTQNQMPSLSFFEEHRVTEQLGRSISSGMNSFISVDMIV
jgi:hypothetical protein